MTRENGASSPTRSALLPAPTHVWHEVDPPSSSVVSLSVTDGEAALPYDQESMAIIHLNNTTVMYLKEVTQFLAMVCFVRKESFERKGNMRGLGVEGSSNSPQ